MDQTRTVATTKCYPSACSRLPCGEQHSFMKSGQHTACEPSVWQRTPRGWAHPHGDAKRHRFSPAGSRAGAAEARVGSRAGAAQAAPGRLFPRSRRRPPLRAGWMKPPAVLPDRLDPDPSTRPANRGRRRSGSQHRIPRANGAFLDALFRALNCSGHQHRRKCAIFVQQHRRRGVWPPARRPARLGFPLRRV